jgi:predicted GNAT family acetyltransferase
MQYAVSHHEQGQRGEFFIEEGGTRIAQMTYRRLDATHILIDHTEVARHLRGQGVARRLLDAAVDWARQSRTRISASCSYVQLQFARDATLRDVQVAAGADASR